MNFAMQERQIAGKPKARPRHIAWPEQSAVVLSTPILAASVRRFNLKVVNLFAEIRSRVSCPLRLRDFVLAQGRHRWPVHKARHSRQGREPPYSPGESATDARSAMDSPPVAAANAELKGKQCRQVHVWRLARPRSVRLAISPQNATHLRNIFAPSMGRVALARRSVSYGSSSVSQ